MNRLLERIVQAGFALFRRLAGRKAYARCVRRLLAAGKDVFVLDEDLQFATTLRPHGFTMFVSARDRVVGWSIVERGEYEHHFTRHFCACLTPDTRFVDVGANIGYYSLLAASRCERGRVYSFEPDPTNYALLSRNVARNGYGGRVETYPFAAGDVDETVTLGDLGNPGNFGARFTSKERETIRRVAGAGLREVRAVRLDDVLGGAPVDLVKMDIEGFEPHAVRGMQGILRRRRPVLFLEFAPVNLRLFGNTAPEAFLEELVALGYGIHVIRKARLVPFGRDVRAVVRHFEARGKQHIDLVLKPPGP